MDGAPIKSPKLEAGQRLQQPAADFDRLDAAAFHAVDAWALSPEICRPAM
jgi:hypothetical protein